VVHRDRDPVASRGLPPFLLGQRQRWCDGIAVSPDEILKKKKKAERADE
jgi:hypothetical protein